MVKDAGAIGEFASAQNLELPVAATTLGVYQRAASLSLANQDLSELMTLCADNSKTTE
jgi:3-hydroxyisobutyrate dehydrogenase-like beta-hydroxyacid dehydrogenase